jgi:hypothetical protein
VLGEGKGAASMRVIKTRLCEREGGRILVLI